MFHYNAANSFKEPDGREELENSDSHGARQRLEDRDGRKILTDTVGARRNKNTWANQTAAPL